MTVGGILGTLLDIWRVFSSGMSGVFEFLNTPFKDLLNVDIPVIKEVLGFILNTLKLGDISLLGLMFGAGISLMIVITIVKWLIDILP